MSLLTWYIYVPYYFFERDIYVLGLDLDNPFSDLTPPGFR